MDIIDAPPESNVAIWSDGYSSSSAIQRMQISDSIKNMKDEWREIFPLPTPTKKPRWKQYIGNDAEINVSETYAKKPLRGIDSRRNYGHGDAILDCGQDNNTGATSSWHTTFQLSDSCFWYRIGKPEGGCLESNLPSPVAELRRANQ